jgi:hypothetical protein
MRIVRIYLLSLLILFSGLANATPVQWTLSGVQFNDGGTASGSFVYDATTNTYSNVNITTTAGSIRAGVAYTSFVSATSGPNQLFAATTSSPSLTGLPRFAMTFVPALPNSGGVFGLITPAYESTCGDPVCATSSQGRSTISGGLVGAPVPAATVPAISLWGIVALMMLLAAVGLIVLGRIERPGTKA